MTFILHPDDVLFFEEIKTAMQRVAKQYQLPLRSIEPMTMPEASMADRMGDCTGTGDIRIVLRCTIDGAFCDAPMSPAEVWDTAAHELAHLRHMNHSTTFNELRLELLRALTNVELDHKERMIAKLVKMQASRDSEAAIGNSAAAEAFAGMINKMLIEYELNPSDLDYVDLARYAIEKKKVRIAWQESLARVVAKSHLCTFLLRPGSNCIWFVGTKSHATVAEYVFGTLVPAASKMSRDAYIQFRKETPPVNGQKRPETYGFVEAWLDAFIERITERFNDARKAAIAEAAADVPGGTSQALMRLDGAMVKVKAYIDDRFKSKRSSAGALKSGRSSNTEGARRGRAAADAIVLGRKGVTGTTTRGLLS